MSSTTLQEIIDKADIRGVLESYCRAADRRDWETVVSLYHTDATDHHEEFSGTIREFVAWVKQKTVPLKSLHHCIGQTTIDLDGDVAYCETYFISHTSFGGEGVWDESGERPADMLMTATAVGRYIDRLERRDDGVWRFAKRICTMDFRKVRPFRDFVDPAAARSIAGQADLIYHVREALG
jgi:hypothetical protein